ncbi:Crp/Fnr family transcriptional regulator [Chishuiella sp.]|uniref:Crp/Fnr family transcriptional regulator n=1 Tax=Chishuiella sp. TaxID=1969467 RepID=UPI0028AC9001|nr:Crp/Fnr family transcriptional regulator [Chishuiella sp.]
MEEIFIKSYLQTVKIICPKLEDETLQFFAEGLTVSFLTAKQFYIQANVVQKEIGYVSSGLIRAFYIDDNGNEKTVNFISEGQYASHYTHFENRNPSKFYFQCLEPTTIVNIPLQHIQISTDKFPYLERYVRKVVEDAHSNLLSRIEGFLFGNAESRYLEFIERHPDWYNRIPLTHICSYLGIERQTLSRIRNKLLRNNL